ncbi:hypothetical protein [Pseudomonas parafulva]|nr:hypothetical protein [Pseudomonas parafulva]
MTSLVGTFTLYQLPAWLAHYAIHKYHLPNSGVTGYRGISSEQFHGSNAS